MEKLNLLFGSIENLCFKEKIDVSGREKIELHRWPRHPKQAGISTALYYRQEASGVAKEPV